MRKIYYSVFTVFALLFTLNTAQAQIFEDFEQNQKLGYASGTVDQSSGTWYLDDALIRNDGAGDLKNGALSVRIREGLLRMEFDVNGANELVFLAGNSSFSGDGGGKIQVFQSTDGGSSWTELDDEITLTNSLDSYSILVETQDDIRFRFDKTAGGRINIDDIRITEYIVPEDEATIDVFVDGTRAEANETIGFAPALAGTEREKTIELKNRGIEDLVISDVNITGSGFNLSSFSETTLAFNESAEVTVTFVPEAQGDYSATLTISSNAVNGADFDLNLQGEGIADGDVMSIAAARELPFGSRVTVSGRVTVDNQFTGPVFIQDGTAGIAVYYTPLHTAVEIGDSITVSGPLTVFNPTNLDDNGFLLQIAVTDDDENITFEKIETEKRIVEPAVITVQELNSGNYDAQLVYINQATINHTGSFQGNVNYGLTDGTADAFIRIDANSNLVGATAPTGATNVVGVVDKFAGDYQLKPRFAEDLGVEAIAYPGEDVTKDQTLDVVTWNIEWFGGGNGPDDLELQFQNVKTVITTIDADLYAFQEISNPTQFARLVDELEDYGGILANFSQQQKTAFLFRRSTLDSLDSGLISSGMTQSMWANGRYPLSFRFNANINDEEKEIYAYTMHSKAMDDAGSYNQRYNASIELKSYLDTNRPNDKVLVLGDFNDTMIGSITSGEESPYKNFVEDDEYTIITKNLEEKGQRSQSIGSFIDHIMFTSELAEDHFEGTERAENTNYIPSYLSTTSDHFPIWTRFKFGDIVYISNEEEVAGFPKGFNLEQNYPNPFNPTTVISYQLAVNSTVQLDVFDVMGRKVATLINNEARAAGTHDVIFDASTLSSGVYIYRLTAGSGLQLSKKMLLLK